MAEQFMMPKNRAMIIKPEPIIIKVNLERIESPLEEDEEMDFFKTPVAAVPKAAFAGKI